MAGIEQSHAFAFGESDLGDTMTLTGEIERGIKIFRVGTFSDSLGRVKTWTGDDLDTAAANFRTLKDRNILPNVPVRQDHTQSVKDVVAYLTDLRREGDFLIADWEWVDQDAKHAWTSKKLRNRSAEIGTYVTNDDERFSPVVTGLAFVDIPAVEGLYRIQTNGESMTTDNKTPEEIEAEKAAEVEAEAKAKAEAEAAEKEEADKAAAEEARIKVEAEAAADEAQRIADEAFVAAGREPLGAGAHRKQTEVSSFRINGVTEVSDFAAVQAHIEELEIFRTESIQEGRTSFIDSLAANKIIGGPQAAQFKELAPTMSNDQWAQFTKSWEGVSPSNLFARHDLGDGTSSQGEIDATAERIATLEGIVQNHRYRGATEEQISNMGSYKELTTLKNAQA